MKMPYSAMERVQYDSERGYEAIVAVAIDGMLQAYGEGVGLEDAIEEIGRCFGNAVQDALSAVEAEF